MLDSNDLEAYLDAFGVDCTKGVTAFRAIYDAPGEGILDGDVIVTRHQITFRSTVALAVGDSITIAPSTLSAGGTFRVDEPPVQLDDGAFSLAYLEEA